MPAERAPEQNTADNSPKGEHFPAVPELESTPAQAEAVMVAALKLQLGQNDDDEIWLQKFGMSGDVADETYLRMVSRGGQWIDFVRDLVGFKGKLSDLRDKIL